MIAIQLYVCSHHGEVILQNVVGFFFFFESISFKSYFSNVEHIGIKQTNKKALKQKSQ